MLDTYRGYKSVKGGSGLLSQRDNSSSIKKDLPSGGIMMRTIYRSAVVVVVAASVLMSYGCSMRSRAEKRYRTAAQQYSGALKNSAGTPEPEFCKAVASFKEIVEKYPRWERSADVQFTVGWMYAARGEFEKAREELVRLYMYFPQQYVLCSRAMYLEGLTYEKQGDEKNAVNRFKQVCDRYPETDAALRAPFHIAEYYYRRGEKEDYDRTSEWAVGEYRDVISGDPEGRAAFAAQSYILDTLSLGGKWAEAAAAFERIASQNSRSAAAPPALFRSAVLYLNKLGKPDESLALLDRLIREYPGHPLCRNARFEKAGLFMQRGDMARAGETCAEIRKVYAKDASLCAQAMLSLGQGYEKLGQGDKAAALYEQVAAQYPVTLPSLQSSLQAAGYYLREGKLAEAGAAFDRAIGTGQVIAARKDNKAATIEAYRCIATALCMQKKWQESIAALKALRKAYPRESETAPALFAIGTIYLEEMHDPVRARYWFTTLLNEYPGHRLARESKQMLDRIPQ